MARDVSGYLPNLIGPVVIKADGVEQTPRGTIDFIGFDGTDDDDGDTLELRQRGYSAPVAVSAYAIDWALGSTFTKELGAGAQVFTFSNAGDGQSIVVVVTGAASTLTWPTVSWATGTAPTQTASGTDVYTFIKVGSTIYGSAVQDMSPP